MDDVDFKSMHMDAMGNLAAIETLVSNTRKLADFAAHYLDEEKKEEAPEEELTMMEDGDAIDGPMVDDKKLYGRAEVLKDQSHKTNVVDRSPKEERKKLALIKLKRM